MTIREPFMRWLAQFPASPAVDQDNRADRVALIVDDRDDDVVRQVFANAVAVLGDTWNHRLIRARGDNDVLASGAFWESIPEEHVLIYQRDTVLFYPVPDAVLYWDMIGAPCGNVWVDGRWTLNGGFSLRRRSAMLDAIDCVEREPDEPEDRYFTRGLRVMGARVPGMETAARFCVESEPLYLCPPVGVHGTDKPYLSDRTAERLVAEAMRLQTRAVA